MSAISAVIIICCLAISAALTVIVILVTLPDENPVQSNQANFWGIPESIPDSKFEESLTVDHFEPVPDLNNLQYEYPHFSPNEKIKLKSSSQLSSRPAIISTTITATSTVKKTKITVIPITKTVELTITPITETVEVTSSKKYLPSTSTTVNNYPFPVLASTSRRTTIIDPTDVDPLFTTDSSSQWTTGTQPINSKIPTLKLISKQRPERPRFAVTPTAAHSRHNFVTVTLQQHIEHLLLNEFSKKSRTENIEVTPMDLIRELTLSVTDKIVGLAMESGLLYAATNDGRIRVMNPETGEQMEDIFVGGRIDRMTVTHDADIVILNGTDLVTFRDGRRNRKLSLHISGKGLSTGNNTIIMLGRSNDVIFVFSNDLKPLDEIYYKNEAKETCNFVIYSQQYYYVSCQSAILKISQSGAVEENIGADLGSYSLGLTADDQNRIIAAVRGQQLLRIFQNDKLVRNLSAESSDDLSQIWSEVLYENGRLHVVDYLTSKLKTFRYRLSDRKVRNVNNMLRVKV